MKPYIRPIQKTEYPLLADFLYHAIFLPPNTAPLPREVIFEPNIFIYIQNFGCKNDCCIKDIIKHRSQCKKITLPCDFMNDWGIRLWEKKWIMQIKKII